MSDGQKNNGGNLGDELSRIFKLGVGAVAGVVEKTATFVDDLTTEGTEVNKKASEIGQGLTRKGEEVLGKTSELGNQLKEKMKGALSDLSMTFDELMDRVGEFTDEQLLALKQAVDQLIEDRKKAPESAEAPGAPEEPNAPEEPKEPGASDQDEPR
ncbi:MAG: hypothetical protein RSE59_02015 [Clostridia bacterium]